MYIVKTRCRYSVEDLDIETDEPSVCGYMPTPVPIQPCCKHNWLSLPLSGAGKVSFVYIIS